LLLFLVFFFCPLALQAEDIQPMPQKVIAEAPSIDPMTEEAINYLLGEYMYQGTLCWQGNKVFTNLITT
tara:strand:+ start:302 stop:508 length:207 start_codon:yes stop_codon:yes gene_type:complete